jgi:hypothetical protein
VTVPLPPARAAHEPIGHVPAKGEHSAAIRKEFAS